MLFKKIRKRGPLAGRSTRLRHCALHTEDKSTNGTLPDSGKRFSFKHASDAIRDVSAMRDELNMTYARKAMIRCGFAKQPNGFWKVRNLFPHLQNIVAAYRSNFDGLNPDDVPNN